ncbi:MAG: hypothetical protein NZ828_11885 [Alphaproteobacteria bacterium]|nr:hypothetical protein [Alphaproteobacteria bacterium]
MHNSKPVQDMTQEELDQKLYALSGIMPPSHDAPNKSWNEYFKAYLLIAGMRLFNDKNKAYQFMREHYEAI